MNSCEIFFCALKRSSLQKGEYIYTKTNSSSNSYQDIKE